MGTVGMSTVWIVDALSQHAHTARSFRADHLDRVMAAWTPTERGTFAALLARFAADVATTEPHGSSDRAEGTTMITDLSGG